MKIFENIFTRGRPLSGGSDKMPVFSAFVKRPAKNIREYLPARAAAFRRLRQDAGFYGFRQAPREKYS